MLFKKQKWSFQNSSANGTGKSQPFMKIGDKPNCSFFVNFCVAFYSREQYCCQLLLPCWPHLSVPVTRVADLNLKLQKKQFLCCDIGHLTHQWQKK